MKIYVKFIGYRYPSLLLLRFVISPIWS